MMLRAAQRLLFSVSQGFAGSVGFGQLLQKFGIRHFRRLKVDRHFIALTSEEFL
jgi:hypothetical protein